MSCEDRGITRGDFLKQCTSLGLAAAVPASAWAQAQVPKGEPKEGGKMNNDFMWAYLMHLGLNMWCDRDSAEMGEFACAKPELRFEDAFWKELVAKMKAEGVNTVVIDLGEGVQYKSHPELAVKGSWSGDRLREELANLRKSGFEPIPKMNFSTCHDTWLGPYARKVSSDDYYTVVRDLIAEAIALFDKPRFFHLGMDEETIENQKYYEYAVVRQFDLWWHDLDFYFKEVEKGGARPWIWSDCYWHKPKEFADKMPKSVLQSPWYYAEELKEDSQDGPVKAYMELGKIGYDLVPTGSNWSSRKNFENTVAFCAKHIPAERLKGFLQTPWHATLERFRKQHFEACEQLGRARKYFEGLKK